MFHTLSKAIGEKKIAQYGLRFGNYYIRSWEDSLNRWENKLPSRIEILEAYFYQTNDFKRVYHYYEKPEQHEIMAIIDNNFNIESNNFENFPQIFNLNEHEYILKNFNINPLIKTHLLDENNVAFDIINKLNPFLHEIFESHNYQLTQSKTILNLINFNETTPGYYNFNFTYPKINMDITISKSFNREGIFNIAFNSNFDDINLLLISAYNKFDNDFEKTFIKKTMASNNETKMYKVLMNPCKLSINNIKSTDDSSLDFQFIMDKPL